MKQLSSTPFIVWLLVIVSAFPEFIRGRSRVLGILRKKISIGAYCFPRRMQNELFVSISNHDVISQLGVGATCFREKVWESPVEHTIDKVLKKGDIALDIGANIGYFSAMMARKVGPLGKVFSFEPTPDTATQLKQTKMVNQADNLIIFESGLGSTRQTATIQYEPSISGNASLYPRIMGEKAVKAKVQIETLDHLFENGQIQQCQFVKIDVEGHEKEVLRGGVNYLAKSKPSILYEFNPETAELAGFGLPDLVSAINEFSPGCEHFLLWGDGHLIRLDITTLSIPKGCYIDMIAISEERLKMLDFSSSR
jgi:FkbM family methyltransferase